MNYGFTTFYDYSKRFLNRRSPTGDLARDMRDDRLFPELISSHYGIKKYLIDCNACDGALDAFETMWHSYRAFLRREGEI